ncbi:hypothetical protein ACH5RR_008852 [Cinchona calisaya]|uniref:DNA-directed RNA polymerase n=1 Tax=Cinchona calisaya TaxID=153742 RepID=A0ABD3AGG4_9GENT
MVCKPLDWVHPTEIEFHFDFEVRKPFVLSDMRGGYLSSPTLDIYNRVGLLSSHNLSNFNIELHSCKYKEMCSILNGLQKQGFQINKKVLEFIKKNRPTLEKVGLLMPGILARVNLKEAFDLLRKSYYQNMAIKGACSLGALLNELAIRAQNARIYRSGILHFHERDLARSLIVFANNHQEEEGSNQSAKDIVASAAAFKYKKFYLYDEALQWYKENQSLIYASDESLISFAKGASAPFQFIAKALCNDGVQEYNRIPITQDATASAYQIMSYLLLNEEMARRMNLILHPDGKIQDVCTYLLQDLKEFMRHRINDKLKMEIIESKLDRKLIKRLFMPLIYGKTLISMERDIRLTYGQLLSRKDSYNLAKLSNEFWIHKYPDIANLMKLINIVSWFCSTKDRAVVYNINYFKDRITSFSNNGIGGIGCDMLYDPLMGPLVQSLLAHFLYMKKNRIDFKQCENGDKLPDLTAFHPNYIRFAFMDSLIANKASVTLGSFKLYDFSPSAAFMDRDKLMLKVSELLQNPILEALVYSFVKKLQVDGDTLDRILEFVQTNLRIRSN